MGVLLPNAALVAKRLAGMVVRLMREFDSRGVHFPIIVECFAVIALLLLGRMMLDWILCFLSPNKVALGRLEAWHSLFS